MHGAHPVAAGVVRLLATPTRAPRLAPAPRQGLRSGREIVALLGASLASMAATSQQWEASAASASAGSRELMERLQQTAGDLHSVTSQLRAVEGERLAAAAEAEAAGQAAADAQAEAELLRAALEDRCAPGVGG